MHFNFCQTARLPSCFWSRSKKTAWPSLAYDCLRNRFRFSPSRLICISGRQTSLPSCSTSPPALRRRFQLVLRGTRLYLAQAAERTLLFSHSESRVSRWTNWAPPFGSVFIYTTEDKVYQGSNKPKSSSIVFTFDLFSYYCFSLEKPIWGRKPHK